MAKSSKLYKDSPTIEKDGEGRASIKKPSKADGEDMGTQGNPQEGAGDGVPVQTKEMHDRHMQEMKDMHERHEGEHKDMHKRHLKEHSKAMGHKEGKE